MEIELNPAATLSLQMDMPRVTRKDMTLITELSAKYRGIKLTLATQGFGPGDDVVKQLDALEQNLVAVRASVQAVMQAVSMPTATPPEMTGHSTDELEADIERERSDEPAAPDPEPWDAAAPPEQAPDSKGYVARPEGTSEAAAAARAKYGNKPRLRKPS